MAIEAIVKNGCRVFRAGEDLGLRSSISELEGMVREALNAGERDIAVSFTANSRLYSNTIAVLVRCISHAEEKSVKLTMVVPNENIMSSIVLVGLSGLVTVVHSEDELGVKRV
jgi:ABC-type transporter Mla MlaB component